MKYRLYDGTVIDGPDIHVAIYDSVDDLERRVGVLESEVARLKGEKTNE